MLRLTLTLLLVGVACTPTPREETPTQLLPDTCGPTCVAELTCQFGRCGAPATGELAIALEFVPPTSTPELQPQVVRGLVASAGAQLPDLRLSRAVETVATVRFVPESDGATRSAAAVLAFEPLLSAGPNPRITYARARDDGSVVPEGIGPLDDAPPFYLAPGTYDVRVTPLETDVPPALFEAVRIASDAANPAFALEVPNTVASRVDGQVLAVGDGGVFGLAAVQVTAASEDGTALSTTGITDADGRFFVILPSEQTSWVFGVTPSGASEQQAYVQFAPFDVRTLDDELELLITDWADPIDVTADVTGANREALDVVTVLAATTLSTTSGSPLGPAVASAVSVVSSTAPREGGVMTFPVHPGSVELTFGALDAVHGIRSFDAGDLDASTTAAGSFALPARRTVRFAVRDPLGNPVQGAQIDVRPTELVSSLYDRLELSLFGASTSTNADGTALVRVQPGTYVIEVSGARGEVALNGVAFEQRVLPGSDPAVDIILDFGSVVGGRLLGPDGAPLAGITVRAWPEDEPGERPLAHAVTDSDGRYRLQLPLPDDES